MKRQRSGSATLSQFVDHALHGADDSNVFISPLVWQPSDGTGSRAWYVTVATHGRSGVRIDRLTLGTTEPDALAMRSALILAFAQHRPLVIHDLGSELQMARWMAAVWPCERTHRLRAAVEAERTA